MLKNIVDFHCSVKTFWYITKKFIWQQFPICRLLTEKILCIYHEFMRNYPSLKIPTFTYAAHVSDVISILRSIQETKPNMSSRIIPYQFEQTNNKFLYLLWTFRSNKLNFNGTETPFQEETWPSPSQLTFMTVDNVDIHPSSELHVFWHPWNSKNYLFTDSHL